MDTTQKRTYFRMRNIDFAPWRAIRLGTLLTKPRDPNSRVSGSYAIRPSDADIIPMYQDGWSDEFTSGSYNKHGIYTKFLSCLGIGVDVGLERNSMRTMLAKVARLETLYFEPTKDYLESVFLDIAVQTHLSESSFFSNLYLVTGVKHAYGSVITDKLTKGRVHDFGIGGDGTVLGVPGEIGTTYEHESSVEMANSHQASSDYVYAYQVKEVHYCKWRAGVVMSDVNGGTLYSNDKTEGKQKSVWDDVDDFSSLDTNEFLLGIAGRKDKTVKQILLMWAMQKGLSSVAGSVDPRIGESPASKRDELSEDEMKMIEAIDTTEEVVIAKLENMGDDFVTVRQLYNAPSEVVFDDDESTECDLVDCE